MTGWDAGGHWVTLEDGQHVLINDNDGTIMAGLGPQNNGKTFSQVFNKADAAVDGINSQNTNVSVQMSPFDKANEEAVRVFNSSTPSPDPITIAKRAVSASGISGFKNVYGELAESRRPAHTYSQEDVMQAYARNILEANNAPITNGSEKQIAWATDLRTKIADQLVGMGVKQQRDVARVSQQRSLTDTERQSVDSNLAMIDKALVSIATTSDARELINNRDDARYWIRKANELRS